MSQDNQPNTPPPTPPPAAPIKPAGPTYSERGAPKPDKRAIAKPDTHTQL